MLVWSAKIGGSVLKHQFVIDTSVYPSYARFKKLYRLSYCVIDYGLQVFIDNILLNELKKNLPKMLYHFEFDSQVAMDEILDFTTYVETIPLFSNSPDPKDNFLFDLALQTNSEVIITKETALLNFIESPIAIHDIKWFKEKFPVEL